MVKQAVKVVVRARPTANFASKNIKIDPLTGTIALNIDKKDEGTVNNQLDSWKFKFDKILQNSSQDEVYEAAAQETVQSVVQGYNGTILCYGQTGAGKTFTMTGSSTNFSYRGVIPRAISQVFREVGNKFDQAITIRMFDLLSPIPTHEQQASHLQIQDDSRGGVAIKNLSMIVCNQEEDALNQLFEGDMNRTVSEHQLNKASSRSHCVFTIHIESRSRVESSDKVLFSKLHLVDLAGSERTKKTGSSGITLKEATFINKSLSFLEQVVIALCDKSRDHVPYRQSKLTNLLRDSLGGNCKTLMIANIWPEPTHLEETVSTLKFATRMMRVSNEAIVNIQLDPHLLIKRYEKEVRDLKQELAMHDTLKNRGRITYDAYSPDQVVDIQKVTQQYLSGQVEEIQDIDSLRKVREIFNQIRNSYRKLKQNVESMQRQIDSDPTAFQKLKQDKLEESKLGGEQVIDDSLGGEQQDSVRRKRKPIDKQTAFIEYKEEGDGRTLEKAIIDYRNEMKDKRQHIKTFTQVINTTKQEMDKIKARLDSKGEEKKAQLRSGGADFQQDFDDDGMGGGNGQIEEIIDEEELMLLKEMKDLKKNYRENYDKLKNLKVEVNDIQSNIDSMKQQLIYNFEGWYADEFEAGGGGEIQMDDSAYNQTVKNQYQKGTLNAFQGDSLFNGGEDVDDDALAFIRAKRKVDTLHKAKKLEKQRPGR
ncbi:kinesin motor domain-containing protein [Stylonychia lemnae]|uniref:Kinesin-like protein n=1 Tax=Stylonychia lemnae TaxID=5949 RepID=A0A078AL62_STYLE|nr:kinesin motor domain-containing protein [Stylonychia lemnae]|eukprot:CDW82929.1 kinesin motor domain-containing protein [Stylonychia lemnae]